MSCQFIYYRSVVSFGSTGAVHKSRIASSLPSFLLKTSLALPVLIAISHIHLQGSGNQIDVSLFLKESPSREDIRCNLFFGHGYLVSDQTVILGLKIQHQVRKRTSAAASGRPLTLCIHQDGLQCTSRSDVRAGCIPSFRNHLAATLGRSRPLYDVKAGELHSHRRLRIKIRTHSRWPVYASVSSSQHMPYTHLHPSGETY